MYSTLDFPLKRLSCSYLTLKIHFYLWKKKSHNKILRDEYKEQHINTESKSYSKIYIYFPSYVPNTHVENLLYYFYFFNIFHS